MLVKDRGSFGATVHYEGDILDFKIGHFKPESAK